MTNPPRSALPGLLLAALVSCQSPPPDDAAPVGAAATLEEAFTAVVERVRPSVVTVTAYAEVIEDVTATGAAGAGRWALLDTAANRYPGFKQLGSATGFVYDDESTILTAWHALLNADGRPARVISVETHDNKHHLCRIVGGEPTINVAVLALEVYTGDAPPQIPPVLLGDSDAVVPGQWALAIGDPAGALRSCAAGLISGTPSRDCYQGDLTATFLQASMTAHPETYGAPVVDLRGEVMGMLMPRYPAPMKLPTSGAPGMEFVMPIKIVANIADSMKTSANLLGKRSLNSPWLGFSVLQIATLRDNLRRDDPAALDALQIPPFGIYIDDVFSPSPAHAAGVMPGDFLVSLDGHWMHSPIDFQKWLYLSGIGKTVTLELFRDRKKRRVEVEIRRRPKTAVPR